MADPTLVKNVQLAAMLCKFFDNLKLSRAEASDVIAVYLGVELLAGNTNERVLKQIPEICIQIADIVKKQNLVNVEPRKPKG